jgi:hypothetical protein
MGSLRAIVDIIVYIVAGGFLIGFVRFILPYLVTATDGVSHLMTYGWPVLLFFCIIMLCALAFRKRRQQGGR